MVRQFIRYLLATFIVAPLFACSPAIAQLGPGGGGSSINQANVNITGGTINGTTIGASTPAAITATAVVGSSFTTSGTLWNIANNGTASLASTLVQNQFGWSTGDLSLFRDGAGILAQRVGTAAQALRTYNTYTDVNNGEWATFDWKTTANTLTIGTQKNGTGVVRGINFQVGGNNVWQIDTSGNLLPVSTNSFNIGSGSAAVNTVRAQSVVVSNAIFLPSTVASLLTCNSGNKGARQTVSDATQTFTSANFGTAVTGGGTNFVPVVCDGTSWKIG